MKQMESRLHGNCGGSMNEVKRYKIGHLLEDGYIYAGEMRNHEISEVYGLAVAPKDEEKEMIWEEAVKFPIQTSKEGSLIAANLGHLFGKEWYWSSTEYYGNSSWVQRFNDGYQYYGNKNVKYRVRCIRRLDLSSFDSLPPKDAAKDLYEKLKAQLEKCETALKKYADPETWKNVGEYGVDTWILRDDQGNLAREYFKEKGQV